MADLNGQIHHERQTKREIQIFVHPLLCCEDVVCDKREQIAVDDEGRASNYCQ